MKNVLSNLGLNADNSIVIGSGILDALGIRKSKDIDLVVTQEAYQSLKELKNDLLEIGPDWTVLGKRYEFSDLINDSVFIDEVRYITLDFLYRAKKSWMAEKTARPKDVEDIKLIERYYVSGIK